MAKEIPSRYNPKEIEERIYDTWEKKNFFHADPASDKKRYTIVIPPPNVTGVLHMGHALNNTIQDVLIRWKKMQGYDVLWLPGTDHAGIATQNVVERALAKEGKIRADLGREKFLERVWSWKEEYGGTIIKQLKKLGCSCDWERTRFTMDSGLSNAVMEVFRRLYGEGLIYKADYIINWCPRCGTALSDEEAEHRDIDGKLYYIKYPVQGNSGLKEVNKDYVVVATTRPETMLGDVAVAVNPGDERYSWLKDRKLILPLVDRELDVIFDEDVDPDFGTGALKVTPAHDPVDFELGKKHGLKSLNAMNPDGTINEVGLDYNGMDRFECRAAIVEELKKRKFFEKTEEHRHAVGHCYRCHTVVEPRLSKQWFVKMKPLAEEAVGVVKEDKIRFHPDRWTKVYLNWMDNIRDWCISRQIWWGHRIPVWYCMKCLEGKDPRDVEISSGSGKGVFLDEGVPNECPDCGSSDIVQDPDVLDTWFSSWLWPFSTFGWPDKTDELREYYPTDTLVTAQEIIFFWVARMIMAGLKFCGDIPFSDIYIHGTVRDATGTKMSKSLGNVIDPLDIIEEVGSDALRYSIISITSQGQDVFLSKEKFEFGRNFANKLWNASRYVLMNIEGGIGADIDPGKLTLADKWIISSFNTAVEKVQDNLNVYRFNDAASVLYDFIWHKYCDWYLEMSKMADDPETTRQVLVKILDGILRLLHPFMPFITEEIWQNMPGRAAGEFLMEAEWPVISVEEVDDTAVIDMDLLIGVITSIRNVRAFWQINPRDKVLVDFLVSGGPDRVVIEDGSAYVERLAKCDIGKVGIDVERPGQSIAALVGKTKLFIQVGDAVDFDKEKERVGKKITELKNYLGSLEKKLGNKDFVNRAPAEVVEKEKAKKERFIQQIGTLEENLEAIG